MWRYRMKAGMSENEFEKWKTSWFDRIPKCRSFYCIHELTSCCVDWLCSCGSIYSTYKSQKEPRECNDVSCEDCYKKYECKKPQAKSLLTTNNIKEKLC